ncbi:MAG TPA: aminotransferase class V-fold PLP-dependent enzyme [Gemmatimonadaceae bacterium]|nr:aminotransferase class V-fold PLP-dependent enzyme [Gemmatimonadaceae bacterium]
MRARTTSRRSFLSGLGSLGVASAALPVLSERAFAQLFKADAIAGDRAPLEIADDESYWSHIQRAFDIDRTMINLNNGGVSPTPSHVLEQMIRDLKFTNELPAEHNWRVLEPRMESTRRELAREFGCDTEEMAVTRNASEALENVILGLDLARGDEVIITNQNYGRMITSWEQRERREGIVIKRLSFKLPLTDPSEFLRSLEAAITPRTKAIELTHITNLSGQIMPIREVVRIARPHGIEVIVDGAHAFAHFPFKRDDLECDYYGTSLHKWLTAPIGAGFLYVRKEKIPRVWPLFASAAGREDNIRKFEEIGTHPQANFNSVSVALTFHRGIGADRKIARLRYLRDRWAKALLAHSERVKVLTELGPDKAGAICLFSVDGMDPVKLGGWLMREYRIVNTPIVHPEFSGIRITPNVYTTIDEIDVFTEAVKRALKQGIA